MDFENIMALKTLPLKYDEEHKESWVLLTDFLSFLRQHHRPTDSLKEIKKSNVTKELKGHVNGHKEINGEFRISVKSVLRYCFSHADNLNICDKVINQIVRKCFEKNKNTVDTSVKEIYQRIAKTNFRDPHIEKHILKNLRINESEITNLYADYKADFSSEDWTKICLFEYHFGHSSLSNNELDYDEMLRQKTIYLDLLQHSRELHNILLHTSKQATVERIQRRQMDEADNSVAINGSLRHSPDVLEAQLLHNLETEKIVCIDCTSRCLHKPSIHIYIETDQCNIESFTDLQITITSFISKRHNDTCSEIIFFKKDTFELYKDKFGRVSRFELRDNVHLKKLNERILHVWRTTDQDDEYKEENSNTKCEVCYLPSIYKPLNWANFDVLTEWSLHVPYFGQIFMETFINKRSLYKADNTERFLNSKLKKLYCLFDTLLNLRNKNFIGIFQEINSQELSMNYQSINTVFSVTSSAGATLSLNESEQRMKEKASSDFCYFNTFLRKYDMEYETLAGFIQDKINLRDCILILMMDNLVRLKYHKDPEPGESRSMQICTLPITLKGLPKNALIVESWHDQEICDGTENCYCKNDTVLTKADFQEKILKLNRAERDVEERFQKLMNWGFTELLTDILNKNIWNTLPRQTLEDLAKQELETSIASLHLDEDSNMNEFLNAEIGHNEPPEMFLSPVKANEQDEEQEETPICESEEDTDNEENFEQIFDREEFELEEMAVNDDIEQVNVSLTNMSLDDSFNFTPLVYDDEPENKINEKENILQELNFQQFSARPLLTRHPPPATGRDDDISKLQEVLFDILIKTDHLNNNEKKVKILFGPDNKIGSNLLKLRDKNDLYKHFLPEFPVLHLRKSKINNLCTAYQHAGLIQIFKYMRDDDVNEWKKLINPEQIDKATKFVRRLSLALHVSFISTFMQSLSTSDVESLQDAIQNNTILGSKWEKELAVYMQEGISANATFSLHADIMRHCDEICAISFAERLGGKDGYDLLLASVKTSLPFSFLNGASSYASFCTKLLHEHYKCGPFYRNMKTALFTTPHKSSQINFGLDSQREMDHQDVNKAFRSGATMTSVVPRMSLIDTLNDAHDEEQSKDRSNHIKDKSLEERLGTNLSPTDILYITRLVNLILRQGGISTANCSTTFNVYESSPRVLPEEILDNMTADVGKYLITKHVAQSSLFGFSKEDIPNKDEITGPKQFLQKVRQSKGVTIRRIPTKQSKPPKSEREIKETQRSKVVAKQTKQFDRISSEMNLCQAIVKPDCSKPKVQKAQGIQKALINLLIETLQISTMNEKQELKDREGRKKLEEENIIILGTTSLPQVLKQTTTYATLEFAGIKFSSFAQSGRQYLEYVSKDVIMKIQKQLPLLKHLAICEEKYEFTPDDFKAGTRAQRKTSQTFTISHLKTSDEVLNLDKYDKKSITTSTEGKSISSIFLAKNVSILDVRSDLTIDIDSELHMTSSKEKGHYATPIRAYFDLLTGYKGQEKIDNINQSKGEAEMSQIDWLIEYSSKLLAGDSICSIVSSGDIDGVVLHLFSISHLCCWLWL